jgi:SAM domain (Sterile alpha motif)
MLRTRRLIGPERVATQRPRRGTKILIPEESKETLDVSEWLRRLGVAQYIPAFIENAIDWTVLRTLTADDLGSVLK